MPKNAPIKTLVHRGLTIEGYSRAAVQTYWRIPEFKLGFDLGAQPWEFMGTPTWFVSHTHLDHMAALPVYVARRRMMKMDPPTIYLPEHAVDLVRQLLRTISRLDRGRLPCELVRSQAGRRNRVVARAGGDRACDRAHGAVPGVHRVGAAQEAEARVPRAAAASRFAIIRLSGVEVSEETPPAACRLPGRQPPGRARRQSRHVSRRVLIAEMTFVAPSHRKDKIHKHGHMHLDDIVQRRDRFENEQIIFAHFSTRYHAGQIREFVEKALPDMLGGRLHLWL